MGAEGGFLRLPEEPAAYAHLAIPLCPMPRGRDGDGPRGNAHLHHGFTFNLNGAELRLCFRVWQKTVRSLRQWRKTSHQTARATFVTTEC